MNETLQFVVRHGYTVLFVWVFAEQMGLPLPAIPLLLAAGALAGTGRMSAILALGAALVAALIADYFWFQLGRRKGGKVLSLLCKISLEPDSCVRKTESMFARHGSRSLLYAKFVPGLNTIAPPLAGVFQMKQGRFLLYDAAGSFAWAGSFFAIGYLFSAQIERVADRAARLGGWALVLVVGALAAYIAWKWFERHRFIRSLRVARITPEDLKAKLDSGEEVLIVDLRHSVDFEADPAVIPGAHHLDAEELEEHHDAIPRDRDVILYCT
jgi:membrane protein DedA with SNARE-associated domain